MSSLNAEARLRSRLRVPIVLALLLLLAVVICACSLSAAPTATPTTAPKPTVTAPPAAASAVPAVAPAAAPKAATSAELAAIQKAWESGPHNNKYDLYHGPNTYCAMCHSPRNWDPKATVGTPPNCFSCKFPQDKEVRISPKAPLIAEADWKKIGCDVCHPVVNGVVSPTLAIWNNGTQKYDAVASVNELCQKCHADSVGGSRHLVSLGGGAHSNQIGMTSTRPSECTDCHDAHTMQADCKTCHAKAFAADKKIQGHDDAHKNVECVGCHDSSGAKVQPVPETGQWTTYQTSVTAGRESQTAGYSHKFQKSADCTRCHYNNNPWKLRSLQPTPAPSPSGSPAAGRPATTPAAGTTPAAAGTPAPSPTK